MSWWIVGKHIHALTSRNYKLLDAGKRLVVAVFTASKSMSTTKRGTLEIFEDYGEESSTMVILGCIGL